MNNASCHHTEYEHLLERKHSVRYGVGFETESEDGIVDSSKMSAN